MPDPSLLDVGRVVKPHGLLGDVIVDLWTNVDNRLDPGTTLSSDTGTLVVASSRPHQGRYIVHFEGVATRDGADALRGVVLRAAPVATEDDALWVHELVGAHVVTTGGRSLGQVVAVEANPASDLLVLDGGGLVPLRFVVSHSPGMEVTVDVPEGLVE